MSNGVQFLTISDDEAGQRLDNFLLRILKKAPKSLIYRIIRKGEVRINKGRAKPDTRVKAGDVVRVPPVRLPEAGEPAKPSKGLLDVLAGSILFESKELLIVNKPSGLAVHGGSGIQLGLVEALRELYSGTSLELVHRLDRDTSGCIVLAKKRSVLRELHALLRSAQGIDKQYLALVKGRWPKRRHSVDVPLLKNELQSGERVVKVSADGKASKTAFQLVQHYEQVSLIQAKPITGRTHQIRVHAQHAKHPLVGDDKYGEDNFNKQMRDLGFKRLFLHASALQFSLADGTRIQVEAPLPKDLQEPLDALKPLDAS